MLTSCCKVSALVEIQESLDKKESNTHTQRQRESVYYNDQWLPGYKVIKGRNGTVVKQHYYVQIKRTVAVDKKYSKSWRLRLCDPCSPRSTAGLVSSDPHRSSCWPRFHWSPRTLPKRDTRSYSEQVQKNLRFPQKPVSTGTHLCVRLPPLGRLLGLQLRPHWEGRKEGKHTLVTQLYQIQTFATSWWHLQDTASSICVTLAKWAVLGIPRQRMPWACLHSWTNHERTFRPSAHNASAIERNCHVPQSASGRLWVPCRCSSRRSRSCSWCSGRAACIANTGWAAGRKTSVSRHIVHFKDRGRRQMPSTLLSLCRYKAMKSSNNPACQIW